MEPIVLLARVEGPSDFAGDPPDLALIQVDVEDTLQRIAASRELLDAHPCLDEVTFAEPDSMITFYRSWDSETDVAEDLQDRVVCGMVPWAEALPPLPEVDLDSVTQVLWPAQDNPTVHWRARLGDTLFRTQVISRSELQELRDQRSTRTAGSRRESG